MTVFPNPTHKSIFLEWDDSKVRAEKIEIYNLLGERVYLNSHDNFTSGYLYIDLSRFCNGSYYVVINGAKGNKFGLFLKTGN